MIRAWVSVEGAERTAKFRMNEVLKSGPEELQFQVLMKGRSPGARVGVQGMGGVLGM